MPIFPATIYNKGSTDKTLILNNRTQMVYPFEASGWTDLRVGFLLSLTKTADDDDITGLSETITDGAADADAYWIGIKSRNSAMPLSTGTVFAGFCNASSLAHPGSQLLSSDIGIGDDSNYWRAINPRELATHGAILDGATHRGIFTSGTEHHFAQDNIGTTGPAGYATLIMIRFTRPGSNSLTITATTKSLVHSGDVLFTDTPTLVLLQNNLETFPTTIQQIGPATLSALPDALYCYWPFYSSRLRIHALGILKAR